MHGAFLDEMEGFVLDGDPVSLQRALDMLDGQRLDLAALLDALEQLKGDPDRRARAIVAVRARLGLPLIPGPVCRPRPLR
ncbi:MAG TPA: hypothetical protein VGE51_05300 [Fontimonas sp.]